MTALAILFALLGAAGYAVGAYRQHGAVRDTTGDSRGDSALGVRGFLGLLRHRRWLVGLVAIAVGAVLHVVALGLAPISVVQPIGVVALPLTVLLAARVSPGGLRRVLDARVILAVGACAVGVAVFVVLAATSATPTDVLGRHQLQAAQVSGVAVLACTFVGLATSRVVRCVAFAAGCAVAYGLVSVLMRGLAQQVALGNMTWDDLATVVGIAGALLAGGVLLQQGYASGPPDLVVACLTVVDPIVAVGLSIGLLGEADRVGVGTAIGEAACAVVACLGVFALARYHPNEPAAPSAQT